MRSVRGDFSRARHQTKAVISLGLSLVFFSAAMSVAAPLYWDGTTTTANADGGNGTWDDVTTNWDTLDVGGADSAWIGGSLATFSGSAGNVTVSGTKSAEGLRFTTGGYSLSGSDLTLVGGATTLTATSTTTSNTTIANNIIITGTTTNIVNTGTGVLTLNGSVSRSGASNLVFNVVGPGSTTINGTLTLGTGGINKSNNNAISGDNDGILTLNNANSYSGNTLIRGGTIRVGNAGALGTGTIQLDDQGPGGSGGILDNATGALFTKNVQVTNTSGNSVNASAKFTGNGDFLFGNFLITGTRGVSVASGLTATFATASSTGNGILGKYGAGTLAITGGINATTASQAFAINEGTLSIGGASSALISTTTINNGKLIIGNKDSLGTAVTSVLSVGGAGSTASSAYELSASANLTGANAVPNPITFGSTQTAPVWTISGSNALQLDGTIALGTTANRLISTTNTATTTFAGVISGGPVSGTAFTKSGGGVLELTADNTYTGNTVVTAGKLLINNLSGTATGVGNVTVNASATIGGSGNMAGNLLGAGTLSPGNSIGSLSVGGTADLDGVWLMELDGAGGSDLLAVTGSLTLDALTDSLSLDHLTNGALVGTYTLATFASLTGTFDSVLYEGSPVANPLLANSIGGTHQLVYNAGSIQLVPSVIPEPSTYALLGLGSWIMLRTYRRRRESIR